MERLNYETTLVELFYRRVADGGDAPAIYAKRDGDFQPRSWNELKGDVERYAAALIKLGVEPGDRVVQLSENRYEWIVADMAIMTAGAIHVPVHAPHTGPQVAFQIAGSGASVVLVENQEQAEKLSRASERMPAGVQIFAYDDCDTVIGKTRVQSWSKQVAAVADDEVAGLGERAAQLLTPDSLATILYTSGTTGEPKGVCLTHRNLVSNALATLAMFDQQQDDARVCFLPLSHIFARTCDLYTWIASGAKLALAESRETVVADCGAVQPTHISGVPYFYDKVYRGLVDAGMADEPGVVCQLLGGRLRMCASGGAALPGHLFDFYEKQRTPVLQGYGLTESSPVITVSVPEANKRGSAGRAIPDVEIRIADDGEILTRGPHVMQGYWQDEAATRACIDADGWLATGDLGHLDDEGFLFITGRKKEIIVTAAGKNIAPVMLESLLMADPLILQAIIIGDDRKYLSALIVADWDHLPAELASRGIEAESREETLQHPQAQALYEERIAERLADVSRHEQVRRFTLLPEHFSIEAGEMTPKLSLRRKEIAEHYADAIEAMYT